MCVGSCFRTLIVVLVSDFFGDVSVELENNFLYVLRPEVTLYVAAGTLESRT